jgi:hypothetical protein
MIHHACSLRCAAALFIAMLAAEPAHAELTAEELAKIAQNPVGNLAELMKRTPDWRTWRSS